MAERIGKRQLDKLVEYVNEVSIPGAGLSIDRNVGGFCVVLEDGRHMSPRGTRRDCWAYLHAMIDAMDLSRSRFTD